MGSGKSIQADRGNAGAMGKGGRNTMEARQGGWGRLSQRGGEEAERVLREAY